MDIDLICTLCGEHVIGNAKDRIDHIKTIHPNILKELNSSVKYFKTPPVTEGLKEMHKKYANQRNKANNMRRKKKRKIGQHKFKHESVFWGKVIKTAFETNRNKH